MRLRAPKAAARATAQGPVAAPVSLRGGGAQASVDASRRLSAQRRLIDSVFSKSGPFDAIGSAPAQRVTAQGGAVAQRYTEAPNDLKVSENGQFAVRREGKDGTLYVADGVNPAELQHVPFHRQEVATQINGRSMFEVQPDLTHKAALDELECGQFATAVTGITESQENENAQPGRSLFTDKVTHGNRNGWDNHYAPVIVADGGDRGTFETAVGLDYCWFGIYGTAKGQTFRYKTQVANLARALRRDWITEETHQTLLNALARYKDGEERLLSANVEGSDYVEAELNKLEELALAREEDLPLPEVQAARTPTPKTKLEKEEQSKRTVENTASVENFDSLRLKFQRDHERRARNERLRKRILSLSALVVLILAIYWYS